MDPRLHSETLRDFPGDGVGIPAQIFGHGAGIEAALRAIGNRPGRQIATELVDEENGFVVLVSDRMNLSCLATANIFFSPSHSGPAWAATGDKVAVSAANAEKYRILIPQCDGSLDDSG